MTYTCSCGKQQTFDESALSVEGKAYRCECGIECSVWVGLRDPRENDFLIGHLQNVSRILFGNEGVPVKSLGPNETST